MIKTTTPNEVILNVYLETSKTAQDDFQLECLLDAMLAEERDEIREMKDSLTSIAYQPKKSSIENILNYSSSFMRIQ